MIPETSRDIDHLHKIFKVCASTPDTKHWLPTREPWVQKIEKEKIPKNLCIRVSGAMIDGPSSKDHGHGLVLFQRRAGPVQLLIKAMNARAVDSVGIETHQI